METTFTIISNTEKEIEVTLSSEEFLAYLDRAAKKLSYGIEIPGFRKGNAPRDMVEQRVGSSALYDEAAEFVVKGTYEKALENAQKAGPSQSGFATAGQAGSALTEFDTGEIGARYAVSEIKIVKVALNNPFVYKIVLRAPTFKLTEKYRSIAKNTAEKEKKEVSVGEKEIDETLDWLSKQDASRHSAKQKRTKQGAVSRPVKPDDAFARSLGEFKDLEALKKSIREGIFLEKEKKEKDRVRLLIAKAIIAKSTVEIPEKVVDREVLKIEDEFTQNISQMGLDLDEYLKKISTEGEKKTKEKLRVGWKDQAKERVEASLLLDAVAEEENIEPDDKEVDEEAQKFLSRFNNSKEADKQVDLARLKSSVRGIIKNEKTFKFLENL